MCVLIKPCYSHIKLLMFLSRLDSSLDSTLYTGVRLSLDFQGTLYTTVRLRLDFKGTKYTRLRLRLDFQVALHNCKTNVTNRKIKLYLKLNARPKIPKFDRQALSHC